MRPSPTTFTTDQQRLARVGQLRPPAIVGDKTRLGQLPRPRLAHPATIPTTPKPLVVNEHSWVIRGKDGTYLGFAFGDGRQVEQLNIYDYLPADRVPHLSNYVLDLTGILPDAIGIDIGASAGVSMASGMAGVNILWHTRGEGSRAAYPEVHVYYGYSGSFTVGAIFQSIISPPNAAAAAQIILAWAREYDRSGVDRPAPDAWLANGFNWTGTFWSTGFSIPIPPRFTIVGSYYQSVPFGSTPVLTSVWKGVSFGIGVSGKFKVQAPFIKLDLTKLLNWRKLNLAINESKTEYGLVYGNGNDFIPATKVRPKQPIGGWYLPINQNNY